MPSPDSIPLSVLESFQTPPPPALSAAQSQMPSMPSESSSAPVPANVQSPGPEQQSPEPVSPSQESPQVPKVFIYHSLGHSISHKLRIKLTPHRLFTMFTVIGFLIPKDVTSAIGLPMVSLHLDWVGSTIALFCLVCEYYVGVTPPVWKAWLHVDRSSEIRLVGYGLSIALVVAVYGAISYAGWELAQHLTARHGFDLATALLVVVGAGFGGGNVFNGICGMIGLPFGLNDHQLVWIIDCLGEVFLMCLGLLSLVLIFRHPTLPRIPHLPIKVSLTLITGLICWLNAVLYIFTVLGEGHEMKVYNRRPKFLNCPIVTHIAVNYRHYEGILSAVGFLAVAICAIVLAPLPIFILLVPAGLLGFTAATWLSWKTRSGYGRVK
ncbi:hypothetical protein B0H17DRAFT_1050843 [Mycena rosella]|uniref:Uncharacterized protein n=1 Tax=Mycena rosella TaxID=1033263 RepID=A0AAD7GK04_MYCRO|nr:hypothetical protein B0H17DRAFT_1050843 [Mycena rosella]